MTGGPIWPITQTQTDPTLSDINLWHQWNALSQEQESTRKPRPADSVTFCFCSSYCINQEGQASSHCLHEGSLANFSHLALQTQQQERGWDSHQAHTGTDLQLSGSRLPHSGSSVLMNTWSASLMISPSRGRQSGACCWLSGTSVD